MTDLIIVGVVVVIILGVIEFVGAYWQILLALAAVGLFVYIIFSSDKKPNVERKIIYEVEEEPPQSSPVPATDTTRLIEIFNESLILVETSANIETVDGRFGDCLHFGAMLAQISSRDLDAYRKNFEKLRREENKINLFDAAIDRYLGKQLAELENLRTAAGKKKRAEKLLATIERLEHAPRESKAYAKKILASHVESVGVLTVAGGDAEQMLAAIPRETIQLLWFADGARRNYTPQPLKMFATKFFTMSFPDTEEPSLIRTTEIIGVPADPAPKLDYFPTYATMTPNARATYLKWLRNVDAAIEIGYVFVFYYGLERWLLAGNEKIFNSAVEMILRLRAHHENKSFDSYSSTALVAASLIRKRPDVLNRLLQEKILLTPILLACLGYFNFYLNAESIMNLAGAVGFTNKRYIKSCPEDFLRVLEENVSKKFSPSGYPLTEQHLIESPPKQETFFANFSMNRAGTIPDVARGETFRRDLSELLSATHEQIKIQRRAKRK